MAKQIKKEGKTEENYNVTSMFIFPNFWWGNRVSGGKRKTYASAPTLLSFSYFDFNHISIPSIFFPPQIFE